MAAPQSPGSPSSRTATDTITLGRALLWPAAAAGLGMLLIYNSFSAPVDDKAPAPPAAAAPAAPVPAQAPVPAPAPAPGSAVPKTPAPGPSLPRSVPTRLRIPALAVDAPFTALSIGESGKLDPLPRTTRTWSAGSRTV